MSDVYATINYVLVNLINEIWEVEGKRQLLRMNLKILPTMICTS